MIKGFPCKVVEHNSCKTGKHGSAKIVLKGKDILTGKTRECTYHAGEMCDAPVVKKVDYLLQNIKPIDEDDNEELCLLSNED